ncbi:MAG TPA: hypothetical protein VE282_03765, partial [Gemmatimonadales bacterium]|nr:hypothetical protein [Gemmatimonadales bacterium]
MTAELFNYLLIHRRLAAALLALALTTACRSDCHPPHSQLPRMDPDPFQEIRPPVKYKERSLRVFKAGTGPPVIIL